MEEIEQITHIIIIQYQTPAINSKTFNHPLDKKIDNDAGGEARYESAELLQSLGVDYSWI